MTDLVKPTGRMADVARVRRRKGILLPQLEEVMLNEYWEGDPDRRTDIIHPSELCKHDCCPLAIYNRIITGKQAEERFNPVMENIFQEGNDIHDKWQNRMRKTGKLWGDWECLSCGEWWRGLSCGLIEGWYDAYTGHTHVWKYREVSLTAEATHMITGSADAAIDDYMVEIKSIGIGTLRMEAPKLLSRHYKTLRSGGKVYDMDGLWKELSRPFSGHVRQGVLYAWMAREMGLPYRRMVYLYEFKANQQVKEFSLGIDQEVLEPLLDTAMLIRDGVLSGMPPDCPYGGCKKCQEKNDQGSRKLIKPVAARSRRSALVREAAPARHRRGQVGTSA